MLNIYSSLNPQQWYHDYKTPPYGGYNYHVPYWTPGVGTGLAFVDWLSVRHKRIVHLPYTGEASAKEVPRLPARRIDFDRSLQVLYGVTLPGWYLT